MVTIRSIILLLGITLSSNAYSLSISIEKSTPDGIFQKAVTLKENKSLFTKNSNYFDKDSQQIGKFQIKNQNKLAPVIKEIKRLEKALDLIASKISNPKSLQRPVHEKTYIKLNSHFITTEHPLFKEIDKNLALIFEQIQTEAIDVMEVKEEDGFLVKIISKNGKEQKSPFSHKAHCRGGAKALICTDDKYGTLFVK